MLSICTTIKNRSNVEAGPHKLKLFPNCVRSLVDAVGDNLDCELVVADWGSNDLPLSQWLHVEASPLPVTIVSLEGTFSRGHGLNQAAKASHGEILFFLDVDMLVTASVIKAGLHFVNEGKAFFPIVFSFNDPKHTNGQWRRSGYGICMMSRSTFDRTNGWPEFKSWGQEDKLFFRKVGSLQDVVRQEQRGLEHQWHPNEVAWKNRYGEPTPRDESDPDEVVQRAKELELDRIETSKHDLARVIPQGSRIVLVDEGRFGVDPLARLTTIPFLERDGKYFGTPSNDEIAITECERMRRQGASFIAFTWISFWWLYFYSDFCRYLKSSFPVLLENERLLVFDLRSAISEHLNEN